ncbi:MAG: hypothetical protein U1D30_21265 [Planctomycetota bacterium]
MIVEYLVMVALTGTQPSDARKTPAYETAPRSGSQAANWQSSTGSAGGSKVEVLPALGLSGSRGMRGSRTSGASESAWSTQRVSAQEPAAAPPALEEPPAVPPAPPQAPAETPPPPAEVAPPATTDAPPPTAPPPAESELQKATPPTEAKEKLAVEPRLPMEDQDIYFRTPCFCTYEPWEMASYYAGTRSVYMWRTAGRNSQLLVDNTTGGVIMETADWDIPGKFGQEAFLGYQMDSAHAIEVSYLWLGDATSKLNFTGPGNADIPILGPADPATQDITNAGANFKSGMWNFELNFINMFRDGTDHAWRTNLFIGARIIGIEENIFAMTSNIRDQTTALDIRAENALYGGQLGLKTTWRNVVPNLNWDFVGKGGVFGNIIDMKYNRASSTGGAIQFSQDGTTETAGALEGSTELVYKCCRNVHLTLGYRVLFVTQIARATNQIVLNSDIITPNVSDTGDILYHGVTAGVRIYWGQRTDPNCRSGCCTPYIVTSGCCP